MTFVLHGAHKIHSQDLYKLDDAKHTKKNDKNKIIHILVHHQGLRKLKKNINVILCSAYHQQSTSLKSCNLHNNKLRKHKMLKSLKTLEIVVNE
jgi:hypothetical protein